MVFWNRDISRGCLHVAFLHGESFFSHLARGMYQKRSRNAKESSLRKLVWYLSVGIWGFVSFVTAVNQIILFSPFCPCNAIRVWITSKHLWTRTSAPLSLFPVVPASIEVFPKHRECEGSHSSIPAGQNAIQEHGSLLFFITTLRTSSDTFSHFGHCQRNDLRTCAPVTDGCRGWR